MVGYFGLNTPSESLQPKIVYQQKNSVNIFDLCWAQGQFEECPK